MCDNSMRRWCVNVDRLQAKATAENPRTMGIFHKSLITLSLSYAQDFHGSVSTQHYPELYLLFATDLDFFVEENWGECDF